MFNTNTWASDIEVPFQKGWRMITFLFQIYLRRVFMLDLDDTCEDNPDVERETAQLPAVHIELKRLETAKLAFCEPSSPRDTMLGSTHLEYKRKSFLDSLWERKARRSGPDVSEGSESSEAHARKNLEKHFSILARPSLVVRPIEKKKERDTEKERKKWKVPVSIDIRKKTEKCTVQRPKCIKGQKLGSKVPIVRQESPVDNDELERFEKDEEKYQTVPSQLGSKSEETEPSHEKRHSLTSSTICRGTGIVHEKAMSQQGHYISVKSLDQSIDGRLPVFAKMHIAEPEWARCNHWTEIKKSRPGKVTRHRPILPKQIPAEASESLPSTSSQNQIEPNQERKRSSEDLGEISSEDFLNREDGNFFSLIFPFHGEDEDEDDCFPVFIDPEDESALKLGTTSEDVGKVVMTKDDEEIIQAAKESEESHSLMPLIKKELRTRIKLRRLMSGEDENVDLEIKKPVYKLTIDELQRRERKKEQNRKAAFKSRMLQKRTEEEIIRKHEKVKSQNDELRKELRNLQDMKKDLQEALDEHMKECKQGKFSKQLP